MFVIVAYDIEDDRKRTRLHKRLKDFGPRVQYSVFEADISHEELNKLQRVLSQVELDADDSIRLYRLCQNCVNNTEIWGGGSVTRDADYYIA